MPLPEARRLAARARRGRLLPEHIRGRLRLDGKGAIEGRRAVARREQSVEDELLHCAERRAARGDEGEEQTVARAREGTALDWSG